MTYWSRGLNEIIIDSSYLFCAHIYLLLGFRNPFFAISAQFKNTTAEAEDDQNTDDQNTFTLVNNVN